MKKNSVSFYDWCMNNNHQDYLDRWNYELNIISPKEVASQSHRSFYFNCLLHPEHLPELKRLDNLVHQPGSGDCRQCLSFGQYLKDNNMLNEWDYEKNTLDMMGITVCNPDIKVWMKCAKNSLHGSYMVTPSHYYEGNRCPCCSHKIITKDDSLGKMFPQSVVVWSEKNELSPYDYFPVTHNSVYWKCENGVHEDFLKKIYVMSRDGFHCPECSAAKKFSYLQTKVCSYFKDKGYSVLNERECSILPYSPYNNRPLPYDNEIPELKLICEVHGLQHYTHKVSWYEHRAAREGMTAIDYFNRRKEYDEYKEQYAKENGYNYLAIPYWEEKDDQYKISIDNKIQEILSA